MSQGEQKGWKVYQRPKSIFGMMAWLATGRAGDGLIKGKSWYRFRRGKLVKDSIETLAKKRGFFVSPDRGEISEKRIGSRWSLWNNCLTAFGIKTGMSANAMQATLKTAPAAAPGLAVLAADWLDLINQTLSISFMVLSIAFLIWRWRVQWKKLKG